MVSPCDNEASMRNTVSFLWAFLAGCGALAGPNPLDRQPGTATPGVHAAAPGAPAGVGQPLRVVDFIKPGARLIYYSGSSTQGTGPDKKVSAGVGMTRYDVVAVTPDKVLLSAMTYLGTGQKDGNYTYAAANSVSVSGMDVTAGSALWMPPAELRGLKSGGAVQVARAPYPLGGQSYDSVLITIQQGDSASRMVFDAGTGLKLSDQQASGPMRQGFTDPFQKQIQSFAGYESYRQVDLLLGPVPPWVQTVKSVTYTGSAEMTMVGTRLGMTATYQVVERGPDWLVANVSTQMQSGFGSGGNPSTQPTAEGPGKPFGLWVSPQALARLQPGVIDRDPTLNTTLTYQVQSGPLGQLGVLSETNRAGTYQLTAGYDLRDGILTYLQSVSRDTGYTITLQLQGRQ
jgi:hypothetical protein